MPGPERPPACEAARRAIHEALGAAALPDAAARHLETCDPCGREAESVERLARQLRALPLPEPPAAFWETLPARVRERAAGSTRRHPWALTSAAAAALVWIAIAPSERQEPVPLPAAGWLAELETAEAWRDPLAGVRSGAEAARVVHRVAEATGLGPRALQQLVAAVDEATVHRPEVVAWNLLDPLGPAELTQVLARLEKGAER